MLNINMELNNMIKVGYYEGKYKGIFATGATEEWNAGINLGHATKKRHKKK